MAEQGPQGFEAQVTSFEHEPRIAAKSLEKGESQQLKHNQQELRAAAQAEVLQSASGENPVKAALESAQAEASANRGSATQQVTRELKKLQSKQTMRRIQRKEKLPTRTLSKVIHQPVIRAVSEGAGKTVSRPSGLLGGGLLAFVGSLLYLYFTKHYGVTYNYFLFSLFFIGGFGLGLVIELGVWTMTRHKHFEQ